MGNKIASICVIALLAIMVICAVKESKVTGTYKAFGIYGRLLAYIFVDGVFIFVLGIIGLFGVLKLGVLPSLMLIVLGATMAVGLYFLVRRKCPDDFKGKLLISMFISGFGISAKIACFFIGAVWTLVSPPTFVDECGRTVYTIGNSVYDGSGRKVGIVDSCDYSRYQRIV